MTTVAERLLEGIDEETVDFRETYDGEGKELVLPVAFPFTLTAPWNCCRNGHIYSTP